jgi:hypothetical protein
MRIDSHRDAARQLASITAFHSMVRDWGACMSTIRAALTSRSAAYCLLTDAPNELLTWCTSSSNLSLRCSRLAHLSTDSAQVAGASVQYRGQHDPQE